jgi:hypothetical protein
MRRSVEDRNTGYACIRRHTPFGSDNSIVQLAAGVLGFEAGVSSTNAAAGARPIWFRQR